MAPMTFQEDRESWQIKVSFLQRWILPHYLQSRNALSEESRATTQGAQGKHVVKNAIPAIIALRRQYDTLLDLQKSIAAMALSDPAPILPSTMTMREDQLLFVRASHPGSHCIHDPELGITCSDFNGCQPALGFKDLQQRAILSERSIRNHCGGVINTHFISVSDDSKWLVDHIRKVWPKRDGLTTLESGIVTFISAEALAKLGILYQRSDILVQQVGARPWHPTNAVNGVSYAHASHWMVHGWIPPQAIRTSMSVTRFSSLCDELVRSRGVFSISPAEILDADVADVDSLTNSMAVAQLQG